MSKHRQLLYGHPVPQSFFDALQEFISTSVVNLSLTLVHGTTNQVQIAAGTNNDQVGIGIDGLWRYIDSPVSTAVTGPAGTYDLYVTCSSNDFVVNLNPPPPEVDNTSYGFTLVSVATGQQPSGVSHARKVGEVAFDGARVLMIRETVGGNDGSALWQPGMITISAAQNPPIGWLLCDGSPKSRSDYAALYAALGGPASPWGQGDGATTFNVPDLRGRAPIGAGQGAGLSARVLGAPFGSEAVTLPTHSHTGSAASHTHNLSSHSHQVPQHGHTAYSGGQTAGHNHASWSGGSFFGASGYWGYAPQGGGNIPNRNWLSNIVSVVATGAQSADHGHAIVVNAQAAFNTGGPSNNTSDGSGAVGLTVANAGSDASHANSQPSVAVNYFIKT